MHLPPNSVSIPFVAAETVVLGNKVDCHSINVINIEESILLLVRQLPFCRLFAAVS